MRGGAQAQLVRCANGEYYVTKFPNSPQGIRILANELLATRLATLLDLPVPMVEVIEVTEDLISNSEGMTVQHRCGNVPLTPGLCCGSRYPRDPVSNRILAMAEVNDLLPDVRLLQVENVSAFACALVFDKWTGNTDARQAIFIRDSTKCTYTALMIDHGFCFGGNHWNFPDIPRDGLYFRPAVYADIRGIEAFEPSLARLERDIDVATLYSASHGIPPEWYLDDSGSLHRLLEELDRRRKTVAEALWRTRAAFPHFFPNWIYRSRSAGRQRAQQAAS